MSQAVATLRPEHPLARSLAGLADAFGFPVRGDVGDVEVRGVSISSRAAEKATQLPTTTGIGSSLQSRARSRLSPRVR